MRMIEEHIEMQEERVGCWIKEEHTLSHLAHSLLT